MIKKSKKVDFFRVLANRSLAANPQFSSAPWKSTVQILNRSWQRDRLTRQALFARFFRTYIGRTPNGHLIVWNSRFWIRSASAALRRNNRCCGNYYIWIRFTVRHPMLSDAESAYLLGHISKITYKLQCAAMDKLTVRTLPFGKTSFYEIV